MEPVRSIKLRWLVGPRGDVSYLTRVQFYHFAPATWQPAINAYRCASCIRICVDLAGVEKSRIDLSVEPERISIRGSRAVPEPRHEDGRALQTLAMEIDYGPFAREIELPAEIDVARVSAEQQNGLLWIILPLKNGE
ncbi:MAG: Hsp20/alpha crystallin family protein [Verrucomicrobiota bacterium]|nr:Hsp20/alpha crystallin family protein [Verrucomicrobiota bacterium]